jgi:hypothetical protein
VRLLSIWILQPVDHDVQAQPDHVHKVPVPGRAFEREVVVRREVARSTRYSTTDSMIAPMVTWKPWKPVSMKKVEP